MTNEERQALLENMSVDDLAKVQAKTGSSVKVDIEDLLLTEFALKFGWQAYKEARDDIIKGKEMMTLLTASRKLDALRLYNDAQASFIGAGAAASKKPSQTFNTLTRKLAKSVEADS